MAEWLRRLTRNQMGSSRAGSNPADCEDSQDINNKFLQILNFFLSLLKKKLKRRRTHERFGKGGKKSTKRFIFKSLHNVIEFQI